MAEVDDGTTLGDSEVVVLVGLLDVVSEVDVLVAVGEVLVSSWASAAGVAAKVASAPAKTTPATRLSALPTVTPNGGDLRAATIEDSPGRVTSPRPRPGRARGPPG